MTRRVLWRAIAFALLAGLCAPVADSLGGDFDRWLPLLAVPYLTVISDDLRRGVRASALAALLILPGLVFVSDRDTAMAWSMVALGLCRSCLVYPRSFGRALFTELAWNGAALLAAVALLGPFPLNLALASWGFWLVQAGFLLSVSSSRVAGPAALDAFERAKAAAEAVMNHRPG